MTFIEEKIRIACEKLKEFTEVGWQKLENVEMVRCGYKTENRPPKDGFEPVVNGAPMEFTADEHAWFRFSAEIPCVKENESIYLRLTPAREGQWDATNPQGMVFIDGEVCLQGLDTNHTEFELTPGKKNFNIYFYAGMSNAVLFPCFALVTKNNDAEKLYYDIGVAFAAMKLLDKKSTTYAAVCSVLDRTCMLLDFRGLRSPEFYKSVKAADAFMQKEYFDKLCGKASEADGEISLIGHTHIDVAWLWTLAQTEEKAERSFSTVIKLMEKYPDYVFMSSQPQLYEYVKQNDPELYEKIKACIKEGRFEPEGAMWLESDTNLVSGESLIRQILYGKKFMKEEFGAENHILWLPDVFGYSAALPQILKKCGVDTFFTTKISWCETDTFPHDNFIWEGIDGSEVFAVLSDSYVKRLDPQMIVDSMKKHVDKKYSSTHLSTFGFGDGGGGPTAHMLENYERLKKGLPGLPKVTMKKSADTLAEIHEQFQKSAEELRFTPKWVGELYLEMHRGTYTTQAANKKNNRKCEYLYQDAESAASCAMLLTGAAYPVKKLSDGWHTILKNQFHDIIPGSSITPVYEDSAREYAALLADGKEMLDSSLSALAKNIKTDGGVFVYNPAPFETSGYVTCGNKEIYAENIPAHGYAVVSDTAVQTKAVTADGKSLENDLIRVEFDEHMHIVSVYDKAEKRELIPDGEKANVLEIYEDYPRSYDAWEITEYYKQKKWFIDDVSSVETVKTAGKCGVKITRSYRNSVLSQFIYLTPASKLIGFETEVDWHEDHVLLKAAFPLDIRTDAAKYEIQFGHISRPTHRNTSWDQAKFEVSAHKWADLSEADYGAALLNDCKYGYSCEENVLKLSLLKAPTYPSPVADRGHHSFTYALYPHIGSVELSDTVKNAYLLNKPMTAFKIPANTSGSLPERFAPVASSAESAVIDTFKAAEDGNGYIVRLYDSANRKTNVTLSFGFDIKKAYLCDMLENNETELAVSGGNVTFPLTNFEIKTVRVIKD